MASTLRSTVPQQLSERYQAALRLPPLACGCRDPWLCRCVHDEPILNAWGEPAQLVYPESWYR